jgi:hypothetical protein
MLPSTPMADAYPVDYHLHDFFDRLCWRYAGGAVEQKKRFFRDNPLSADLTHCLTWAPVRQHEGLFEIDPTPRPPKSAWRWIIAVRSGLWDMDPLYAGRDVSDAQKQALCGEYVWDLFACDPDLRRVTGRFTGSESVVGWPLEPDLADKPVRVHETPESWLRSRCDGVLLCGDSHDEQAWLRGCTPGVVVSTIALGEALRIKMRRPLPPLPPILVSA